MSKTLARHPAETSPPREWIRFAGLDMRSLAPYTRTMLVTVAVLVALAGLIAPTPLSAQLILTLGLVTLVPSTLFATDETAGLELLYMLLPIRRSSRVVGRYLSVLVVVLASVALGGVAAWGHQLFRGGTGPSFSASIMLLAAMLVLQAVQLPLFFGTGYQRARLGNLVILMAVALLIVVTAPLLPEPDGSLPLDFFLIGGSVAAIGAYTLSGVLSLRIYKRREQ